MTWMKTPEEIPEEGAGFWYGYLYNLLKVLKEIL
jgi:hypothetical protein